MSNNRTLKKEVEGGKHDVHYTFKDDQVIQAIADSLGVDERRIFIGYNIETGDRPGDTHPRVTSVSVTVKATPEYGV